MTRLRPSLLAAALSAVMTALMAAAPLALATRAEAASAGDIHRDARNALERLYRQNPAARAIGAKARAVLIFPSIIKGGLVFGGAYGEGELIKGGRPAGFYSTASASWGLQAGAQAYGYAVFLMNQKAVNYLEQSKGWEIGVGPTVVVVDAGKAANLSTTTLKDDAYAFIFGQKGLMAGISLEGSKVSHIHPKP